MSKDLQINETEQLTPEEQLELATNIDRLIEVNKNNRQVINRLVFESVAAMTEADDAAIKLSRKGILKRWIGGITGSNQKLQTTINKSRSASQNAVWLTIQKLAEQNLMTFDLITAVNIKLNASLTKIDDDFSAIYKGLVKFFNYNKNELTKIENRLAKLEQNVELLNWKNSIKHQVFKGVEYDNLDITSKIVCLARDFYDITEGNWNISDLLLLKSTMDEIGIRPKENVNYFNTIKNIADNKELKEKFLGVEKVPEIKEVSCLISMSALKKIESLNTDEKYTVDAVIKLLKDNGMKADTNIISVNLTKEYLKNEAHVDVDVDVESYDFIIDLLYNLRMVKEQAEEETLLIPDINEVQEPKDDVAITPNDNEPKKEHNNAPEQKEVTVINKTDEYINNILQININEKKIFENRILHFNTHVNCEGTLEFDNCTIYYNEYGAGGKITLAEGAMIKIRNSEIICKGFDNNHFITNDDIWHERDCVIEIENTKFFDCSYLIKGKIDSFTINNCEFNNCYVGLAEISNSYGKSGVYVVTNNIIKEFILSAFNYKSNVNYGSLFYISVNENIKVQFLNNRIIEKCNYINDGSIRLEYIHCIYSLNVANCYFEGLGYPISAQSIENCHFKDCKACIDCSTSIKNLLVENCLFENSTNVIKSHDGGKVRYCQFVSCYNKLIETSYLGGLTIEFCEFYNTKCLRDILGEACIEFRRDSESKTYSNYLKNVHLMVLI